MTDAEKMREAAARSAALSSSLLISSGPFTAWGNRGPRLRRGPHSSLPFCNPSNNL